MAADASSAHQPQEREESKEEEDAAARPGKEILFKAVTRTVFLRKVEVVFDPDTDVRPHKGMRPLCNFEVKGVPLYVHAGG